QSDSDQSHRDLYTECTSEVPRSFHSEYLDCPDVRIGGEQVCAHLAERLRDLTVQMRLSRLFGLEGVEDPVPRVVDLERVPRHRSLFAFGDLTTAPEECGELLALAGLRLESGQDAERHCHGGSFLAASAAFSTHSILE